ncbi:MAG: IS1380 family transposase [Magnetococcales bacterium]|nr:IS1380 family transposase [Magnetococcales bacterium]MBF0116788.1 IS1380 family transposase [Magnetococcales bacterium]
MRRFILEQSDQEFYTSHSGLALAGACLNRLVDLNGELKKAMPLRHGISHGDIVKSYLGLLCQGKSDFEAIDQFREDGFFREALGIERVPSIARMRQRMDEGATVWQPVIARCTADFMVNAEVPVTPLATGHVVVDIDVFPMDNSGTKKAGVSRTYKGYDGYAPIAAYLGEEGWCVGTEFREGKQHSQKGFIPFMGGVLTQARRLSQAPLLVRLDSGHDALESRVKLVNEGADFILKWNPRTSDVTPWLKKAEEEECWEEIRPGKFVSRFSVVEEQEYDGRQYRFRRVMEVTERRIDRHGQHLLVPDVEVEGWWTSLEYLEEDVIALYNDHGTSEQFHSEFKTDLDLERLPSGKFATNALVMTVAAFSYNILRWIGLLGLTGKDSPVRHAAKRRRLRTVIQEMIYLAARLISSGRRMKLRFGRLCPAFGAFERVYGRLAFG